MLPALLSSTLHDLIEWLRTAWAMAVHIQDGEVRHAYVSGESPARSTCLEYVATVTRRTTAEQDWHLHVAPADTSHRRPSLVAWSKAKDGIRALAFGPKMDGAAYSVSDCALIFEAAAHFTPLLERDQLPAHSFCGDLIMARDIQRRSLKRWPPSIQGLEFYGDLLPGSGLAGEFFDFVALGKTTLAVAMGAISGQGVGAALLMSGLQGCLRGVTHERRTDLAGIVSELNRISYEISEHRFMAPLFYAQIEPASSRLRYVNAGHEPVLLIRSDRRKVELLESTGAVLGLSWRSAYGVKTVAVCPGDILIACSEAATEEIERTERGFVGTILETVRHHPDGCARDIVESLLAETMGFQEARSSERDRTIIALHIQNIRGNNVLEDAIELARCAVA